MYFSLLLKLQVFVTVTVVDTYLHILFPKTIKLSLHLRAPIFKLLDTTPQKDGDM